MIQLVIELEAVTISLREMKQNIIGLQQNTRAEKFQQSISVLCCIWNIWRDIAMLRAV